MIHPNMFLLIIDREIRTLLKKINSKIVISFERLIFSYCTGSKEFLVWLTLGNFLCKVFITSKLRGFFFSKKFRRCLFISLIIQRKFDKKRRHSKVYRSFTLEISTNSESKRLLGIKLSKIIYGF